MRVRIRIDSPKYRQIDMIKALRKFGGQGLRDAKNTVDSVRGFGHTVVEVDCQSYLGFVDFRHEAQIAGYTVAISGNPDYVEYVEELRTLASQMRLAGHEDIASDVLHVVNMHRVDS